MGQPPAASWRLSLAATLATSFLGRASSCVNSAGDDLCQTYVAGPLGGQPSHCERVLTADGAGLRVADVCQKACGRCGTLLEADAETSCFAGNREPFGTCCATEANFISGTRCTTSACTDCWGGEPTGLFETCCLDQDPCRDVDCGAHGRCVATGYQAACHCDSGWVGADGLEGREPGASAPFCSRWNGFKTRPDVGRLDTADSTYYNRATFLGWYGGSEEWDSAAGLEQTCWDATHTHSRCCTPLDGTGDASCWDGGDYTYSSCLCEDPCGSLDCGAHGSCDPAQGACVCLTGYTGASCESWGGGPSLSRLTALGRGGPARRTAAAPSLLRRPPPEAGSVVRRQTARGKAVRSAPVPA